ncbi:PspA/IM30 family protein [Paenibacillus beijingensis]|uniref:Phage-shock protein n=1 Tax=Paenibacillus beijingensis TaxID=1126833 RepID=A0A0D5NJD6_9BACL|nr:PspA/IM30 family protein [Paenibacillus beijingensis]AJY75205.1 hypothetical protein VN24_12240 [Paenibacillus beijingensis]
MSVLARILNLTKATANEVLSKLEDPVMMMNQYVRNMEDDIDQLKSELARLKAASRAYNSRLEECVQLAELQQSKAADAMSAGLEAEARLALEARLRYTEQSAEYKHLYDTASMQIAALEQQLDEAKAEYETLLKKREDLSARIKKAEAESRTSAPSFSSGIHHGAAARGFGRVEEKILQWEAQLDLSKQSRGTYGVYSGQSAGGASGTGAQDAGAASAQQERTAILDEQLAELRRKLKTE